MALTTHPQGEYTGRSDINGNHIHAGDKAKTDTQIGVIEYNPDILAYVLRRENRTFIRLEVIIDKIEIIQSL